MLHKEVNQSRLGQLWQVSDNLFVYQMEATGQSKFFFKCLRVHRHTWHDDQIKPVQAIQMLPYNM